jgi:predicted RNase H-like HicB family nuclease
MRAYEKSNKKNPTGYKIIIEKDNPGFLVKVKAKDGIIAWGETKEEALKEMEYVLDALIDLKLEEIENERHLRDSIKSKIRSYAIQVP